MAQIRKYQRVQKKCRAQSWEKECLCRVLTGSSEVVRAGYTELEGYPKCCRGETDLVRGYQRQGAPSSLHQAFLLRGTWPSPQVPLHSPCYLLGDGFIP